MKEFQFEVPFVDDGTKDRTLKVAKNWQKDECIKYVSFSRNFGKEAKMYAGFGYASGEYVITGGCGFHKIWPSLLPEMMRYIKDEGYDSVATRRVTRKGEPKIRSFCKGDFIIRQEKISDTEILDGSEIIDDDAPVRKQPPGAGRIQQIFKRSVWLG